jgi:hypothetical protein
MPQPGPQNLAIRKHLITELLFGGAVGGGKSDFLLGDFAQDVPQVWGKWCRGILFRRTYGELDELVQRSQEIYPQWFPGCRWKVADNTWEWPNGATLKMRYLEHTTDWMRYWGHQYTWIGWDELPSWPNMMAYLKMIARLRSAHPVPNKRIRATGNPGGPGHHEVKAYFAIDRYPNGSEVMVDPVTGMSRMFIKSRVQDNAILLKHDPGYINRLKGLGSVALVKAWLDGDWSVVAGAYFDAWDSSKHIIVPFKIPDHWLRFTSLDWGSAAPFSVGWWAVSDGSLLDKGECHYPAGALIRYREWYGASAPNVGLHLAAEDLARGILSREINDKIDFRVADPSCWKVDGGPSIAERMANEKVFMRRADNSRLNGWDQVRNRLTGEDAPMLYTFNTCTDFIRTFPVLQHDIDKPEDVDTDGEDHCFAAGTDVLTPTGLVAIEELPADGLIYGVSGIYRYRSRRLVRANAEVVRLNFADGSTVICTPDHRFMRIDGTWKEAQDFVDEMGYAIDAWNPLSSPRQFKNLMARAIIAVDAIFSAKASVCTEPSGNIITEKFPKDFTSITRTMTPHTTMTAILNVSLSRRISALATAIQAPNALLRTLERHSAPQRSGTGLKKAARGMLNIMKKVSGLFWGARQKPRASTVAKLILLRLISPIMGSGVAPTVRHVRCVSVEPLNARQDVYCITVPKTGHFALGNGLIVSNCGDEVRYACMSRPWTRKAPFIEPIRGSNEMTMDELVKYSDTQRGQSKIAPRI